MNHWRNRVKNIRTSEFQNLSFIFYVRSFFVILPSLFQKQRVCKCFKHNNLSLTPMEKIALISVDWIVPSVFSIPHDI